MSSQKKVVLCPLHPDTVNLHKEVVYKPELEILEMDLALWSSIIEQHRPKTIIFGGGVMNADMLAIWRSRMPNDKLLGIRRGTTLARCDVAAAKKLDIHIVNTPGVNAPFVAQYVDTCIADYRTCAILGVGNVGEKVAKLLAKRGWELRLFSRNLQRLKQMDFSAEKVIVSPDLFSACRGADAVVVALPLTDSTRGLLTKELVEALLEGCKLVSISLTGVFTPEALQALHGRADISVVFDGLVSSFPGIFQTMNVSQLRKNFILVEKAARSDACQKAMDEAVFRVLELSENS